MRVKIHSDHLHKYSREALHDINTGEGEEATMTTGHQPKHSIIITILSLL